jgi:hypothetical protein
MPHAAPRATTTRPSSASYARLNHPPSRTRNFARPTAPTTRFTRDRFGRLHRVSPVIYFGSVYPGYYPYDYNYGDYNYANSANYSTDQAPDDANSQQPTYATAEPPAPSPSEPAAIAARPPEPATTQLILMRNDGQFVLATAFTVSADRLTYITQEGARRSFPISELDKDTTRKMNDANGTSVSLP